MKNKSLYPNNSSIKYFSLEKITEKITINNGEKITISGDTSDSPWYIGKLCIGGMPDNLGGGTLLINRGAIVNSADFYEGYMLGGSCHIMNGSIIVDGEGSKFTHPVGGESFGLIGPFPGYNEYGSSELKIINGGTLLWAGIVTIENSSTITVDGSGSLLKVATINGMIFLFQGVEQTQSISNEWTISNGGKMELVGINSLVSLLSSTSKLTINIGAEPGNLAVASGIFKANKIEFCAGMTLNFNMTDETTFNASLVGSDSSTGPGGIINQIAGTTIFTGDNTQFSGTVNITGGTVQLGDGGTTGNFAVNINTGTDATHKGALAFNRSDNISFDHVVSGTGSLVQMGSGMTTLTQNNTYSGGTVISNGILSISSISNLGDPSGGITLNGGTLRITG
jgi:autotransporter-associated beta strand protein